MPDVQIPLPMAPAPCWRCSAPSQRHGLRYDLCPTCQPLTAEVVTLHQRPLQASEDEAGDD